MNSGEFVDKIHSRHYITNRAADPPAGSIGWSGVVHPQTLKVSSLYGATGFVLN